MELVRKDRKIESRFFGDMQETDPYPEAQRKDDGPAYTIQDLV